MYQVEWMQSVELTLLEFWALVDALLWAQIRAAVNELERRLSLDPLNEGESRIGDDRVTYCAPLGVNFSVDSATKTVTIFRVWLVD